MSCSICQTEFKGESVTFNCGHTFHLDCFNRLINTRNNIECPLCRRSLMRFNNSVPEVHESKQAYEPNANDDTPVPVPLSVVRTRQRYYCESTNFNLNSNR